jgi:hypothetical protein
MEDFNIEDYRISRVEVSETKTPPPTVKKYNKFIKGPLPLDWFIVAAGLPCGATHVALVLWYLAGLKKNMTVSLPNKPLKEMKIGKNTKSRALKALVGAGLIKVVQKRGNSPVVTILEI